MKEDILEEKILYKEENTDEFLDVRESKIGLKKKFNYKCWIIVSSISIFISLLLLIILKYVVKSNIFWLFFAITIIFSIILIVLIIFKIKRDKKEKQEKEEAEKIKLQQEEENKKR